MAKDSSFLLFSLLFLAIAFGFASSARLLLDDKTPGITTTLPSGHMPATMPAAPATGNEDDTDPTVIADAEAPAAMEEEDAAPAVTPIVAPSEPPETDEDEVAAPEADPPATAVEGSATTGKNPQLSFYMHDIIGGSQPSERDITGIMAQSEANGIPFSKANNLPVLAGLIGSQSSVNLQNSGRNNVVNGGGNQPFGTTAKLPAGASLQSLVSGKASVIDEELTEGHELGSSVVGKAQGVYLASSSDGTSETMVLTLLLHGDGDQHEVKDTISLFGVHRTALPESQIAVISGTGKYENARGYAILEKLQQKDQHTTDGVDTIIHLSVYLSDE